MKKQRTERVPILKISERECHWLKAFFILGKGKCIWELVW